MATAVYDPKWVLAETDQGRVRALAFTLSRKSPSHTGELTEAEYRRIFSDACGKYGTTLEYAARTMEELARHNIRDRHLERLLKISRG
jgi:cation transport protein ChaC